MNNQLLITIFFCLLTNLAVLEAQVNINVFNVDCDHAEALERRHEDLIESYKSSLKKYKHKKKFLAEIEKRQTRYLAQVENQEYYCEPHLDALLDKLLNRIIEHNQQLGSKDIRLIVGRYPWVNASFIGDNTIIINLGLLLKLKTEDELAFILSHELAHLYLDHLDTDTKEYLNVMNSKETKKKIKKIKRSKYKKYSQAESLLKNYVYDHRRHSRNHEFEADSMGFVFYQNSGFKDLDAINALNMLDRVDSIPDIDLQLDSIFNYELFPFQDKWMKEKKAMFGGKVQKNVDWNVDSLKTHPQCEARIKVIQTRVNNDEVSTNLLLEDSKHTLLAEEIRSLLHFAHVDYALVKAVELYKQPETQELGALYILDILQLYHELRLNHSAGNYIGSVNKAKSKHVKEVRLFLKNMRTKELASLRYYFANESLKSTTIKDKEYVMYQKVLAAEDAEIPEVKELLKTFQDEYPNSIFKF